MNSRQKYMLVLLIALVISLFVVAGLDKGELKANINQVVKTDEKSVEELERKRRVLSSIAQNKTKRVIVFDGLTLSELGDKLNRSMNSTIAGQGHYFAAKALELGVDPYMALAISLHETGCKWGCSHLARTCYNIGGQKGSPGCPGIGAYKRFNSLREGIDGFLNNLYNNYVKHGLRTPEQINPRYAENPIWYQKVRMYMNEISKR